MARTEFKSGAGCTYCNMTGYRGRIGVYELLEMDGALADAIRRTDLSAFSRLALRAPGYVPIVERALQYLVDGTTSVEELMRVMAGLEEPEGETLLDDVLGGADAVAAGAMAGSA
jgi:MSHA biogenesis protein MshE